MKISILLVFISLFLGCAGGQAPSYDSFSYRESDFQLTNITVSDKGLSEEQISSIIAARFPPENTVSIAVIFLQNYRSYNSNNIGLAYYIMNQGKNNEVKKWITES